MTTFTFNKRDPVGAQLEPLLTVRDLERLPKVNKRTIARLCKTGQLPKAVRIGGGNRWRVAAIVAAIEKLECGDVVTP